MKSFHRITLNPAVMGGKACVRDIRVTVGMILERLAIGQNTQQILEAYPYLEAEDIAQALAYAAWRMEEQEMELPRQ